MAGPETRSFSEARRRLPSFATAQKIQQVVIIQPVHPEAYFQKTDFLVGLNATALIRDGGSLQIGIGELGDALIHAVLLRHRHNSTYREWLISSGLWREHEPLMHDIGGAAPFDRGLYGASEMLVDGFMDLHKAGILKRRVYGFWALQQLVNEGRCDPERLSPVILEAFDALGVRVVRGQDFETLQYHGFFTDDTRYDHGHIVTPDGTRVLANIADPQARRMMGERCLGTRMRHGTLADAAFFLGTTAFYDWLRNSTPLGPICAKPRAQLGCRGALHPSISR